MRVKLILIIFLISIIATAATVSAASKYGSVDVYYNDKLYPGNLTPKPLVKIDEPFRVRFDITCYRKVYLSVRLDELGDGSTFIITDGPTMSMDKYNTRIVEANETVSYEWTLKPSDRWAGGSMPLNFIYQMTDYDRHLTLTQGEFTAAYVTISNEYYEPPATTKPGAQSSGDTALPTLPAFTLLGALMAIYMVYVLKKK